MPFRILTVVGARPQFVKCAALRKVIDASDQVDEILVHTGQHYDFAMSQVFFDQLGIRAPEHALGINGKSHGAMTGEMLAAIESLILSERPDAVLVYGDTNSTLAGALAAAKLHVPVIHVEAGLRSFNKRMPEEINRIMTDHVSDLLFCSTSESVTNLANEGIRKGVHHVGDIMYDVTRAVLGLVRPDRARETYGQPGKKLAMSTIHRAENTADPARLQQVVEYVRGFAGSHAIVLPLHPGTRARMSAAEIDLSGLTVIDPLPYLETQELLAACDLILTDSGGMQKEAYFHGVDCITLRDETEWVETIACGWNRLWTVEDYKPRQPIAEYGDGDSAERILGIIEKLRT
ncbi:non-hydrolyzing UDP-N-acetylglucosamine 2-epimerase [Roseinatronobacter monicus]|uniref:UDP-GlcNAc3NAcA epimerase n=1 Tax=Roseinatronobacter monicus TaxID=393481 RepID=A0A543K5I8_9RHOB|nr:UDP-N-acetylglucosamine 2-epimerase (non-hydrolyzing) [Roseinatronobacter monicus]TQM90340.1 UDP-GlcNAc3NAcA epimerase [Roseinatronobacter monicus]